MIRASAAQYSRLKKRDDGRRKKTGRLISMGGICRFWS